MGSGQHQHTDVVRQGRVGGQIDRGDQQSLTLQLRPELAKVVIGLTLGGAFTVSLDEHDAPFLP